MDIQTFAKLSDIPYHKIWYYIDDLTGKKIPLWEKNNSSIEDINRKLLVNQNKPTPKYKKSIKVNDKWEHTDFSEQERNSLVPAYTLFLKHTNNVYYFDIDDPSIN